MKYTLFGESHGSHIGIVLDNVPAGLLLDRDKISFDMKRRSAKALPELSTPRHEADEFEIISGVYDNRTTGAPLCGIIKNTNIRSKDYDDTRHFARPSHADFAAHMRYKGHNDFRGGGHFSGRLTAPLVFAGAIAKQFVATKHIEILARIREIAQICDSELDKALLHKDSLNALRAVSSKPFPTLSDEQAKVMQSEIVKAKDAHDSVGGIIECFVLGLEAGFGAPSYGQNLEGLLSQALFSIPAVKGIEFGTGFELARMCGSNANDQWLSEDIENNKIIPYSNTNHNGGINGGISNGMPINFSVVLKPTPSIAIKQNTIDMRSNSEVALEIKGRHDPCIVPRAVPVVEAATALAISTLFEERYV